MARKGCVFFVEKKLEIYMDKTFKNEDILLSSFLLTQTGITLIDIVEDYSGHFVFLLSNVERCIELKQQYLNNAPAPARQLFSQREMLISEIKTRNRNGGNYGSNR